MIGVSWFVSNILWWAYFTSKISWISDAIWDVISKTIWDALWDVISDAISDVI